MLLQALRFTGTDALLPRAKSVASIRKVLWANPGTCGNRLVSEPLNVSIATNSMLRPLDGSADPSSVRIVSDI